MTAVLVRNTFQPGRFNNYLIAGNVCNAFALGEIGSSTDFFLIGAEPPDESPFPLLTGNILDSEGQVLFRLVRNLLVINPGHCSKILGDHIGYEIHDSAGQLILSVRTAFENISASTSPAFVTTIKANFYDKSRALVFRANSGEPDEKIEARVKCAFGFSGGFGLVQGMSSEEVDIARLALSWGGLVHEPIRGLIQGQDVILDGKVLINADFRNCTIRAHSADWATIGKCNFDGCQFVFDGPAANMSNLVQMLMNQKNPGRPQKPTGTA